jgi:hypothetical protein
MIRRGDAVVPASRLKEYDLYSSDVRILFPLLR